jgi:endonuclease/exonuclease/phosphatase family metal-dependent hydrolase
MSFTAATYNVLATAYINPQWYAGVPPELLDPGRRIPALVRHVESLDADLLCLQEVEADTFAALRQRLGPLGYEGRCEMKGGNRPDGCAVFFRRGLFTLRAVQRLDYHNGERGPQGDSGHVALLLCLEHEGRLLGVADTHLRWDRPGTPRTGQVGLRQIVELMETCASFSPACRGWLVCGDFNSTPDGEVVDALRQGGFEFAHAGRTHVRSCVANRRARLIDYLFHTGQLRSQPFDPPPIEDRTKLPSEEQPSDHVALMAEIGWV